MARHIRTVIVAVIALAAISPRYTVHAQQAETSPFAPVATPTLDPKLLETPKATPADDATALKPDGSGKAEPGLKVPNRVDLGKFDLELKAGRTSDVNPRNGLDSGETSNIEKVRPGKSDSPAPDYFGLKLTAPTR